MLILKIIHFVDHNIALDLYEFLFFSLSYLIYFKIYKLRDKIIIITINTLFIKLTHIYIIFNLS